MKRLAFVLLTALVALPVFAPAGARAVPPPSPRHDRAKDFLEIAMAPEVFGSLNEPVEAIRVVDGDRHVFSVETRNCTMQVRVDYHGVPDTGVVETHVEVGRARCR